MVMAGTSNPLPTTYWTNTIAQPFCPLPPTSTSTQPFPPSRFVPIHHLKHLPFSIASQLTLRPYPPALDVALKRKKWKEGKYYSEAEHFFGTQDLAWIVYFGVNYIYIDIFSLTYDVFRNSAALKKIKVIKIKLFKIK